MPTYRFFCLDLVDIFRVGLEIHEIVCYNTRDV